MPSIQSPEALRRRLRVELKRARTTARMTQRDVAEALDWSPSKVIRIESGQVAVTPTDLRALLDHYGVKDKRFVDELVAMARNSKKQSWTQYRDVFSPEALSYFGYEASASITRQYEPLLIPGLLQTEEYMRAVFKDVYGRSDASVAGQPQTEVDRLVEARQERQDLLERKDPPEAFFILDESAILRHIGGSGVMRRQLQRLVELNERPKVSIQILSFTEGAHPGLRGPFVLLEFPDPTDDDVVYLENARGDLVFRDEPEETSEYLSTFWRLEARATPPADLEAVVKRALDRIGSADGPDRAVSRQKGTDD